MSAFAGIYAATVCPMLDDGSVDPDGLRRHLADMAASPGLAGVLVNGHAGENFTLSAAEQARVVAAARAAMGPARQVIVGVNAEASASAAALAAAAQAHGADALLVFPPFSWALSQDAPVILAHHRAVAAACDLPLMLYQAPVGAAQLAYTADTLRQLLALPRVAAIKEGSWETAAYEANRRLVRGLRPDVAVMASGDEHLLPCFVLGSDGCQVSLAAVAPDLIVGLADAVADGALDRARAVHDRIQPLAQAIYATRPAGRATARLKYCLFRLGRIRHAACRAPMAPLPPSETLPLDRAMQASGLVLPPP